jgi:GTP-binding protein
MVVAVPVGTIVWKVNGGEEQLADLVSPGVAVVIAVGGRGGRGNARFASATKQAPRIAEKGLEGEQLRVRLELRLLAEVGLVGMPNAGKSSLLRSISSASPGVGAYPFTTLEPHLGVVELGYETLVVADIPGLIAGAHEGKGLGVGFLQHIERTQVLVHMVDGAQPDPVEEIAVVRRELQAFGHGLETKHWLVAFNKIDLPEARAQEEQVTAVLRAQGVAVHSISAQTGEGVAQLMQKVAATVQAERQKQQEVSAVAPLPVVRPPAVRPVKVVRVDGGFEVRGDRPSQAVEMLGVESEEARAEVMRRLRRMGVGAALRRAGVQPGDRVRIGKAELEWWE